MFDYTSLLIGVENQVSRTISNQKIHFVSGITPLLHQHVRVIRGILTINGQVTAKCNIQDDCSKVPFLEIKYSFYVPDPLLSIMRPQYWDHQEK